MFSQHAENADTLSTEESLVSKIYRLTKDKNEVALAEMARNGICIGIFQGEYNAITLLAMEGDKASVDFLVEKFLASRNDAAYGYAIGGYSEQVDQQIALGASRSDAVWGYARGGHVKQANHKIKQGADRDYAVLGYAAGGHVKQANRQIKQGVDRDYAVLGYAFGGHVKQVNRQIEQGARRDYAVLGYARGGHIKQVNRQIKQGASRDYAVYGYARRGYVKQVNHQIKRGASRDDAVRGYAHGGHVAQANHQIEQGANCDDALWGYARGGHVRQVNYQIEQGADCDFVLDGYLYGGHITRRNILRLMAFTDDKDLRNLLAEKAHKKFKALDINSLQKQAVKINRAMNAYQLTFQESQSLFTIGTRSWLLQGVQLVRSQRITADIFWTITSLILGSLSINETRRVFDAVHNHLFSSMKGHSTKKHHSFFRIWKAKDEHICKAEERHEKRITF